LPHKLAREYWHAHCFTIGTLGNHMSFEVILLLIVLVALLAGAALIIDAVRRAVHEVNGDRS